MKKECLKVDELEAYKGKWKNLDITSVGCFWGRREHDTQEAAKTRQDEWEKENNDLIAAGAIDIRIVDYEGGPTLYFWSEHLSGVQMPIGDE